MSDTPTTPDALIQIATLSSASDSVTALDRGWLSASEIERLSSLHVTARREQYLAGHWMTRLLLAERFGGAAHDWRLQERKGLPPTVLGPNAEIRVSISHSGLWIACAVAAEPIGIDLEQRPRQHTLAGVEALLLADGEQPGSIDHDGLLQRWVAKEAYIKMRCSSAMPERLRQIQLHRAFHEQADVRVRSAASFHFGLAVNPQCRIEMRGEDRLSEAIAWRVEDRAS